MLNLKKLLTKVLGLLDDLFIIKTYSATITAGGNNYGYASATALGMSTPSGYIPLAIRNVSSDVTCPITTVSITASGAQGAVWVRNVTSAVANPTISLSVIYVKSIVGGGTA